LPKKIILFYHNYYYYCKKNIAKVPIIVFDNMLEQFRGKVMFPVKLAKANEVLSREGYLKRRNK